MPHEMFCYGKPVSIQDPRDLGQKLRRKELEAVLDHKGIMHEPGVSASKALSLCRSYEVDFMEFIDEHGRFKVPESNSAAVNPENMKMTELRKYCAQNGVAWKMTDKKVELQEKIRESQRG